MAELSKNERIKEASNLLRGTIAEGLGNTVTGALAEDDTQLGKFHGFYQQDDRDLRGERLKKKLEPAYSFMVRVRMPGGVCSPEQWLKLDRIATERANHSLRLTTRQTFQFHGILKGNMRPAMRALDDALLDTIAACGDVNRNVLATSNPWQSGAHAEAYELARRISEHLLPQTGAWREIWIDGEKKAGGEPEIEPIYGRTYLPRKFKTVVAVPPNNEVDVFAQDLGFVAVLDRKVNVTGWTVTVGGGMGMTHGDVATFPRTADVLGVCKPEDAVAVAEHVVTVQRDWGDRTNRKHARLKYTIEDRGIDAFRAEVERRLGKKLGKAKPVAFTHTGDRIGWVEGEDGLWHFTVFVENGRLKDTPERPMLTGLRKLAAIHDGEFRLTANQNLIVAKVRPQNKAAVEAILREHGLHNDASALRLHSMACVALPTCGLALAESERYLPELIDALDERIDAAGLRSDAITIRMTGCPNGCARPFMAEIGLVGTGPGKYNLYLGGSFEGTRLNKLYRRNAGHDAIVGELGPLFDRYAKERDGAERFGDWVVRAGVIAATTAGRTFHQDLPTEVDRWAS